MIFPTASISRMICVVLSLAISFLTVVSAVGQNVSIIVPVDGGVVVFPFANKTLLPFQDFVATLVGVNVSAGVSFTLKVIGSDGEPMFVPFTLDTVPANASASFSNNGVAARAEPTSPLRMSAWSLSPTENMTATFNIDTTKREFVSAIGLLLSASSITRVEPAKAVFSMLFNVSFGERRFFDVAASQIVAVDQCDQPPDLPLSWPRVLACDWTVFDWRLRSSGDVVFVNTGQQVPFAQTSLVRALSGWRSFYHGFSDRSLVAIDSYSVSLRSFYPFRTDNTVSVNLRTFDASSWELRAAQRPLVPIVDGDDLKFFMDVNTETPLFNASLYELFTTCTDWAPYAAGMRTAFLMGSRCYLNNNRKSLLFAPNNQSESVMSWDVLTGGQYFLVVRNFTSRCPNLNHSFHFEDSPQHVRITLMWNDAIVWQPVELPRDVWSMPNGHTGDGGNGELPVWSWVVMVFVSAVVTLAIGFVAGRIIERRHARKMYTTLN